MPLSHICLCPDAQKKTNGLSPVASDVVSTVLCDEEFWPHLKQLTKVIKPLVDAIGNIEARDASLADCMLELIRCAQAMIRVPNEPDDDVGFMMHAQSVFNRRFHSMNTNIHSFALFLHPLCRKLAISQAANGRSFKLMAETAFGIAKQWKWTKERATCLREDLKQYYQCKGLFVGGSKNGLEWWENLPTTADKNPLKALAIIILSIVPHAGEVERLFSALGNTQSRKRCNLSVQTFETLGKLRANYARQLYQQDRAAGKPIHRRHAHMHTRDEAGINPDLVNDLETSFTWKPPFSSTTDEDKDDDDIYAQPEDFTLDELDEAWDELEKQLQKEKEQQLVVDNDGGEVYDFAELEKIDREEMPASANEEMDVIGSSGGHEWDVDTMMLTGGI
jgi:hypothetical protein